MMKKISHFLCVLAILLTYKVSAQDNQSALTIRQIMQGPAFVGSSPSRLNWSEDSEHLFFEWNPDQNFGDSLYVMTLDSKEVTKVAPETRRAMPSFEGKYSSDRSKKLYTKNGRLFLQDLTQGFTRPLIMAAEAVNWADFSADNQAIHFVMGQNAFRWDLDTEVLTQLTNVQKGSAPSPANGKKANYKEWLENDQLQHFKVLKERKAKEEARKKWREQNQPESPLNIYLDGKSMYGMQVSPDGRFVTYNLVKYSSSDRTVVPNFVTESGYTENINARPKVGSPLSTYESWIADIQKDTTFSVQTDKIPGIRDIPEYMRQGSSDRKKKNAAPQADKDRDVIMHGPYWTENGQHAVVVFRAMDNKDRWIMTLDPATGNLTNLDRQHDEAWVAGPGIEWYYTGGKIGWMPDQESIWYISEKTGYAHLYTVNVKNGKEKALTKGEYEIYDPQVSKDGKHFYFHSNEVHPGERHFYQMPIQGGEKTRLTFMAGRNDVTLSPDEKTLAILHSTANEPWDLYLKENSKLDKADRITDSRTEEFKTYSWRTPEYITFEARDGAEVHARLYKPENAQAGGPAVVFVHGAGYLQNAHKWWSSYYREYMFHNFLADNGYTVLDIDYRGSAGYGRDWRTGIYQHMGGKDLSDQVDGANYLVEQHGIDPAKLGIYGGSYGGFITLMAMFTEPDVFQAGAALRSVTDWAHYNHGYTSNILNTPVSDSTAYIKSSPIYYADGLKGALLICHGMVDDNVQFQDVVRLAQRLIELEKEDWEMAVYPVEPHGFKEPSSWTDEYRRIYKLFEENLKGKNL